MAVKANKDKLIRLVSTAGTGYYYTTTINKKNRKAKGQGKLELMKYDPRAIRDDEDEAGQDGGRQGKVARGKHVIFKEDKVKG